MALDLRNLDDITRKFMVQEIEADISKGEVYHSKFLTSRGRNEWNDLLLEAAKKYDSTWLSEQLINDQLAVSVVHGVDIRGRRTTTRFPRENLSDSEFNRYYMRGLCLRAIDSHITRVITYRAKPVAKPISRMGIEHDPRVLLEDLRTNKGKTESGVPSNPNSGISIHLPYLIG